MSEVKYAHTLPPPATPEDWELLSDHLKQVERLAGEFGEALSIGDIARLSGRWHDVGKFANAFQAMLYRENGIETHLEQLSGKPDHSTAGAVLADETLPDDIGRLLAYSIAGHHAGLTNWSTGSDSDLRTRLSKNRRKSETDDALTRLPDRWRQSLELTAPPWNWAATEKDVAFQLGFLARFLFSCLVDADFLATEAFLDQSRAGVRQGKTPTLAEMKNTFDEHLAAVTATAPATPVNSHRARILRACRAAAQREPRLFTLTVPTGGGKTYSSLAFGLDHAVGHDLRRVIYAIPFTSIIEQNADSFRKAMGPLADQAILEHHSNLDPDRETPWNRLTAENWDAPLVVTTNVQLFESLFASRTSRCRKLHNIARSVIILDEVQTLPVELLQPTLAALRELIRNYGCTIVLCSATQPALIKSDHFPIGLDRPHEIIDDPVGLYQAMKRVTVSHAGRMPDADLATRLADSESALCVVNTKKHARELFRMLPDDGFAFHLSTLMTPEHRSATIKLIRQRLTDDLPCRVVSTQLIEAGVDLDFETVYRAEAGLDAIAQAAGRCNREGRRDIGQVVVFEGEHRPPPGFLGRTAAIASEIIPDVDDLIGLGAIDRYFRLMYGRHADVWDKKRIMDCFRLGSAGDLQADFRIAAEAYRLIDQDMRPIIVDRGDDVELTEALDAIRKSEFPSRRQRRMIQRHTVQVRPYWFQQMEQAGCIEMVNEQFPILLDLSKYDHETGLILDADPMLDPEALMT